jgi:hypothetical protein
MKKSVFFIGSAVILVLSIGLGYITSGRDITIELRVSDPLGDVNVVIKDKTVGKTDSEGHWKGSVGIRNEKEIQVTLAKKFYEKFESSIPVTESSDYAIKREIKLQPMVVEMPVRVETRFSDGRPAADISILVNGQELGQSNSDGSLEFNLKEKFGSRVVITSQGSTTQEELVVKETLSAVAFTVSDGLPVEITSVNNVAGVEVVFEGQVVGKTNKEGKTSISIPVSANGASLQFRMPGTIISDWFITPVQMQANKKLQHQIKVAVAEDVSIKVQANLPEKGVPAIDYDVMIGGVRKGSTNISGESVVRLSPRPLVGDRIDIQVVRGKEGLGNSSLSVIPGKLKYEVSVSVEVPKIVRLMVMSDSGSPINGVLVKRDGVNVGKTNEQGNVDAKVGKLDVVYRFTFHKKGFTFADGELVVQPASPLTEREVQLESLNFWATFVDSLSKEPVLDMEVYYDGSLVALTEGVSVKIPIAQLGRHSLELRSNEGRYPSKQERSVEIKENSEEITVYAWPKPFSFNIGFNWKSNGKPIKGRQVRIKGDGFIDQKKTGEDGRALFSSYSIVEGRDYSVELQLGQGIRTFSVNAKTYDNSISLLVDLSSKVRITTKAGQEDAQLKLYRSSADYFGKKAPLHSSSGTLLIEELPFGEYFLVAEGEATIEKKYVIADPTFQDEVDTQDPFVRAEKLEKENKINEAMDLYMQVADDNPKYHDAQKKLGFHFLHTDDFSQAVLFFDQADLATHRSDPYFYLAAAQANHRAQKYDRSIEFALKAFTYRNLFQSKHKQEMESHTVYLQTLSLHDQYGNRDHSDNQKSTDEKLQKLKQLKTKWENYLYNYSKFPRDAQVRLDQVKSWTVSL